ncbi:M28 family peptidase [Chryseolinea sp. T2]|uniref:M28 family peptidase n=1 Tax=Chryseolinea sp. T2 TaxID=3129255 RepID=UPI003076B845
MRYLILIVAACFTLPVIAQKKSSKTITDFVTERDIASHITFLAADEMRGRDTGSPELDIAANYIMTQFMAAGVQPAGGSTYFHPVSLKRLSPPSKIEFDLSVNGTGGKLTGIVLEGHSTMLSKPVVYAGYGTAQELDKIDVKGKIVVCLFGGQRSTGLAEGLFALAPVKRKAIAERGGVAVIEIMPSQGVPWAGLQSRFGGKRIILEKEEEIPHLLMQNLESEPVRLLQQAIEGTGTLTVNRELPAAINGKNVIGVIPGSDPVLRNEYIAVSAHYDHVGVDKHAGQDSIFNGARDNAIGTTLLLETARYFTLNPVKRSILLVALTAEEVGLLGSYWYAEHPVIPLKQTVFDLNCDGAGYNDKSIATIIDFNRTTADVLLRKACTSAGLELKGDPAPEQGLFDRSDNVNFARKGVPSVNVSPGVKAFDQELMKYYHQPADEVQTLDMQYLARFYRAMLFSVQALANADKAPVWKSGDKYEAAGKELYAK